MSIDHVNQLINNINPRSLHRRRFVGIWWRSGRNSSQTTRRSSLTRRNPAACIDLITISRRATRVVIIRNMTRLLTRIRRVSLVVHPQSSLQRRRLQASLTREYRLSRRNSTNTVRLPQRLPGLGPAVRLRHRQQRSPPRGGWRNNLVGRSRRKRSWIGRRPRRTSLRGAERRIITGGTTRCSPTACTTMWCRVCRTSLSQTNPARRRCPRRTSRLPIGTTSRPCLSQWRRLWGRPLCDKESLKYPGMATTSSTRNRWPSNNQALPRLRRERRIQRGPTRWSPKSRVLIDREIRPLARYRWRCRRPRSRWGSTTTRCRRTGRWGFSDRPG